MRDACGLWIPFQDRRSKISESQLNMYTYNSSYCEFIVKIRTFQKHFEPGGKYLVSSLLWGRQCLCEVLCFVLILREAKIFTFAPPPQSQTHFQDPRQLCDLSNHTTNNHLHAMSCMHINTIEHVLYIY